MRTRSLAIALNPHISAIGDFAARSGPSRQTSGMSLREFELGLQAEVDPYSRADIYFAKADGKAAELEEAYVTLKALPLGLQVRGGQFLAQFGRLNMVHGHERPQADSPFVLERFLGDEGLREAGGEVSRVFAPFGVFTELSYGLLRGLGEAGETEPATTTVADAAGNPNVPVRVHEEEPPAPRRFRDYAHVARGRAYADLNEAANVELGLSGATHQPQARLHRQILGADVTFRWKPPREALYRSFIWRTEVLWSRRRLPAEFDSVSGAFMGGPSRVARWGVYSYAEVQPARRWRFGLRGDYAEDPGTRVTVSPLRGVSPFVTFALSEFQRFRVQYQARGMPNGQTDHHAFLQWTVILGPHGAHPF